MLEKL